MRSRVLPSTAGVRVRSAAPRPVALSLHNRQVQEPPAPARQLAALSDERQLLRARSTELRGSPLRASTDRAFACLPNLISLCSAGAPPALLLSSASACTPRLPACLPVCLHLNLTSPRSPHHTAAVFSALTAAAPLDILSSARQYQYIHTRNHLPNPHQRSGGRARPAPFSLARQLASNLAIDRPHSSTTRHDRLRLIISNGFE